MGVMGFDGVSKLYPFREGYRLRPYQSHKTNAKSNVYDATELFAARGAAVPQSAPVALAA